MSTQINEIQESHCHLQEEVQEQRITLKRQKTQNTLAQTENKQLQTINDKLQQKITDLQRLNQIKIEKKDKKIESLKGIIEEKDQNIAELDQQNQELMQEAFQQQRSRSSRRTSFNSGKRRSLTGKARRGSRRGSYDLRVDTFRVSLALPQAQTPETFDIFTHQLSSENVFERLGTGRTNSSDSLPHFVIEEDGSFGYEDEFGALSPRKDEMSYLEQIKRQQDEIDKLKSEKEALFNQEIELRDELRKLQQKQDEDEESELKDALSQLQQKYEEEKALRLELEQVIAESDDEEEEIDDEAKAPLLQKPTQNSKKLGFWDRLLTKCQCMPIDETNDYS